MPRTTKHRKICYIPHSKVFQPEQGAKEEVTLTFDEMEALRLADLEALDQDEAARRMEISRATFQRVLYSARKTVAGALVNGKRIRIQGGAYKVADNRCDSQIACENCRFQQKTEKGE